MSAASHISVSAGLAGQIAHFAASAGSQALSESNTTGGFLTLLQSDADAFGIDTETPPVNQTQTQAASQVASQDQTDALAAAGAQTQINWLTQALPAPPPAPATTDQETDAETTTADADDTAATATAKPVKTDRGDDDKKTTPTADTTDSQGVPGIGAAPALPIPLTTPASGGAAQPADDDAHGARIPDQGAETLPLASNAVATGQNSAARNADGQKAETPQLSSGAGDIQVAKAGTTINAAAAQNTDGQKAAPPTVVQIADTRASASTGTSSLSDPSLAVQAQQDAAGGASAETAPQAPSPARAAAAGQSTTDTPSLLALLSTAVGAQGGSADAGTADSGLLSSGGGKNTLGALATLGTAGSAGTGTFASVLAGQAETTDDLGAAGETAETARMLPSAMPILPGDQLAMAISRLAPNVRSFSMQLNPEQLGTVDVKLSIDDKGNAKATFSADRPETLTLLQQDSHHLVAALQDAGVKVDQNALSFSLRDPGNGAAQNGGAAFDQGGGRSQNGGNGSGAQNAGTETASKNADTPATNPSRLYDIRA